MKSYINLTVALCSLLLLLSCAENKTLDELLTTLETDKIAMGTVSIFKDDKEIYNNSFGYKNLEKKERANDETRYWIGSISKVYTATLILQLIEEGKLSYDTRLAAYFPDIPNAKDITIKNLLQHQSGIYNITRSPNFEVWIAEPRGRKEMIAKIMNFPSEFRPGEKTSYSNTNFVLLSYILEDVESKSFEEILTTRILKKLDLKRTSFADILNLENNEAMDYFPLNNSWSPIVYQTNLTGPMGAGGIISTAKEVNIFFQALFNGDILNQKSLKEMTTAVNELGMGLGITKFNGMLTYGHNGAMDGFKSIAAYAPELGVSIALTFNCSRVSMTKNLSRVFEAYTYTYREK